MNFVHINRPKVQKFRHNVKNTKYRDPGSNPCNKNTTLQILVTLPYGKASISIQSKDIIQHTAMVARF